MAADVMRQRCFSVRRGPRRQIANISSKVIDHFVPMSFRPSDFSIVFGITDFSVKCHFDLRSFDPIVDHSPDISSKAIDYLIPMSFRRSNFFRIFRLRGISRFYVISNFGNLKKQNKSNFDLWPFCTNAISTFGFFDPVISKLGYFTKIISYKCNFDLQNFVSVLSFRPLEFSILCFFDHWTFHTCTNVT